MKTFVFANDNIKDIKYIEAGSLGEAWDILMQEIEGTVHYWYNTEAED